MGIDRIKTLQNYAGLLATDTRTMLVPTVRGTASFIKAHVTAKFHFTGVGPVDPDMGKKLQDVCTMTIRHKTGHQPVSGRTFLDVNILNAIRTGWDVPTPGLAGGEDVDEYLEFDVIFPYIDPRKGPNSRDFAMPVEEISEVDFTIGAPAFEANTTMTDVAIDWDILFDPDDDTIGLEFSLDYMASPTPTPILTGNSQKITDIIFKGDYPATAIWLGGVVPTCSIYQEGEPIDVNATYNDYWLHYVLRMMGYGAPDEYTAAQLALYTPLYSQAAYYSTVKTPTAQYQVEYSINPAATVTINHLIVRVRPFSRDAKRRRIPLLASIPPSVAGSILKPKIPRGKYEAMRLKPQAANWLPINFQKAIAPEMQEFAKTIQGEMAFKKIPMVATGELLASVATQAPKVFFM